MIRKGENPEHNPNVNKFLGYKGEGHRGLLLAVSKDGISAIMVSLTSSLDPEDGVVWGSLYEVIEKDPSQWPRLKIPSKVDCIPDNQFWTIIPDLMTGW